MKRTPIISGEGILNLIPQRPPIVMVDSFCGIEDDCSYSGLTVTDDNIFCQEGKLQEARIGYIYLQKNEPVPLGFIGSVDKLTLHRTPETGQELSTEITVIQEVFDITLISACVSTTEGVIAECRMKIFLDKK